MSDRERFRTCFESLTGNPPFPWQEALFERFAAGSVPSACGIPTGLGKTSVIAVWILALALSSSGPRLPRRLVYVVNRRTVVDQSTREAERMRGALKDHEDLREVAEALRSLSTVPFEAPLAISTLRGQFADNAEWRDDPARPAVIVGTVDMIGSRLLFSGYGNGFKSRPLHAGFLGRDVLLVHDEAHLEPAFQRLIETIEKEQRGFESGYFRVMALTATARSAAAGDALHLTPADEDHEIVKRRIEAKKGLVLHPIGEPRETSKEVARLALEHQDSGSAVLVFLGTVKDVDEVAGILGKTPSTQGRVQVLTGTQRGHERDRLATVDPIFARFARKPSVAPMPGTVYLVCTSAGEVGVDLSADHLVCDLSPFDSMTQRLGRVNRFGDGDARVDVVHVELKARKNEAGAEQTSEEAAQGVSDGKEAKGPSLREDAIARTFALFTEIDAQEDGRRDVSPAALSRLPEDTRIAAFSPAPTIVPATDILFDAWALTSLRGMLPGRPPVADWLHGLSGWEPPETYVGWREEVGIIVGDLTSQHDPEDLIEAYPLKPHELLRDRTDRVFERLERMAGRDCPAWVIDPSGAVEVLAISELVLRDRQKRPIHDIAHCTVLLPPSAGGLTSGGMLDGSMTHDGSLPYDVADEWGPGRRRIWDDQDPPQGMRLVLEIDTRPDEDEDEDDEAASRRFWRWYARPRSADDDGSRTARKDQSLDSHLGGAERYARGFASRLDLGEIERDAVILAARWHDRGKDRALWQRSVGNRQYPDRVLAKACKRMKQGELSSYRHELGSLGDLLADADFQRLPGPTQDLALHLVAAHHGRARPHFPVAECFDPAHPDDDTIEIAHEVPRRFGRLQGQYGRWGLAWLESLVRAADILASQDVAPTPTLPDAGRPK